MKSIKNHFNALNKFVCLGNEISLASHLNHSNHIRCLGKSHSNVSLSGGSSRALFSISKPTLSQKLFRLLKITLSFRQYFHTVLKRGSSNVSQLLNKFS